MKTLYANYVFNHYNTFSGNISSGLFACYYCSIVIGSTLNNISYPHLLFLKLFSHPPLSLPECHKRRDGEKTKEPAEPSRNSL